MAQQSATNAGVTIDLPAGWSVAAGVATSVSDPVERIAIASVPVTVNPDQSCVTQASNRSFSDQGAMVIVLEYTSDVGGPVIDYLPRPGRFGPDVPKRMGGRIPTARFECFDGSGWIFRFTEQGRRFLAWILLGPEAASDQERVALSVLSSLRVTRTPALVR